MKCIYYRWMYKSKLCKFFIRIGDSVHALATCIVHYYVMYNVQTVGRSQQISISIFLIAKSESFRIEKREERKKKICLSYFDACFLNFLRIISDTLWRDDSGGMLDVFLHINARTCIVQTIKCLFDVFFISLSIHIWKLTKFVVANHNL